MADEPIYLPVGDLLSARVKDLFISSNRRDIYVTAMDLLRLVGLDPEMKESEVRRRMGTEDE